MARGGKREGAGRKPGSQSTKTAQRIAYAQKAAEEGATPLEVMLEIMKDLRDAALKARGSADADEQKQATKLMMLAADVAKDAAPYIHPRLAAVEHTGADGKDLIPTGPVINLTLNK